MDKSTLRHRVSVAMWDEWRLHAFVRGDDGNVEHFWPSDGDLMFGPEDLGGKFDTDPIATFGPGGLHLVGRVGSRLVDWVWPAAGEPALLGAPQELVLPGLAVADPDVLVSGGALQVFAPSLDGPMRRWFLTSLDEGWQGPDVLTEDIADPSERPCAVRRPDGLIDVFSVDTDNNGLRRWFQSGGGWASEHLSRSVDGQRLQGRPTALWSGERRLDVFAVRNDGVPIHWGFDGQTWFTDEVRVGSPGAKPGELTLISPKERRLTLVASTNGAGAPLLSGWNLDDQPPFGWLGPQDLEGGSTPTTVWLALTSPDDSSSPSQGQMNMLSRNADGSFSYHLWTLTNEHSIDGRFGWENASHVLKLAELPYPPETFTPANVEPNLLARRPDDLVLMGVRWNDAVQIEPGEPTELVASRGAQLSVTLPPQHVAEQVVDGRGPATPSVDPQFTGGVPVWSASASGPSRVVVSLEAGTRVHLTVEGVLEALLHGALVPSSDATDTGTQIELPYRFLMTPFRDDEVAIGLDHAPTSVQGPGGAVGLWNTRISASGVVSGQPAGLTLRPLAVDNHDPFRTSLSGPSRSRILREEATADIHRLRLSALGGTLAVAGTWPTFEWDHVATLGRDQKVRTATQGVICPYGNRAMYVETSERQFEATAEGSVAHLRKRSVLIITEPVRDLPPSRAFPFQRVEFQRTLVDFGADPVFEGKKTFPVPGVDELIATQSRFRSSARDLRETIDGGDMGPIAGQLPVEDLALGGGGIADEVAQAASQYVDFFVEIARIEEQLRALQLFTNVPVDVFMVPGGVDTPLRFPILLSAASAQVQVDVPVVFVADIRRPDGLLHPSYRSLEDPEILKGVEAAYIKAGDGEVAIAPTRIDMVGSGLGQATDRPEVRRLHIVGESRDGGFAPRLGIAPKADEDVPPDRRWGFAMALPEIGTLSGQVAASTPVLRMALSTELLSGAPDPRLLFRTPKNVDAVTARFSGNSSRSGGLSAPDLKIDAVSRRGGPVEAATFLAQVTGGHLTPASFLGESASLLGFSLIDLIKDAALTGTPEILADPTPGRPPRVTMTWLQVPLQTKDSFLAADDATMDIEVVLSPTEHRVRCTVSNVALAFPTADEDDKLLEVRFKRLEFLQEGSNVPSIDVDLKGAQFFGFLKLLEDLQNSVKFAGGTPGVHASDTGVTATFDLPVPNVTTGGFQLTGLTFHGFVDVPFDERPVSIGLAFASRQDPFNLSVLALGGGGYVDIVLDKSGLKQLEIALEFGASLEIDFIVASGEVHAMGGIRVVKDEEFDLEAYLRFGGMVEVLGLVSVSIELLVTLTWKADREALVGQATLVLEIDLFLFSDSVEIDSGEWTIGGDDRQVNQPLPPPNIPPGPRFTLDPALGLDLGFGFAATGGAVTHLDVDAWRAYRAAFDEGALP